MEIGELRAANELPARRLNRRSRENETGQERRVQFAADVATGEGEGSRAYMARFGF